MSSQKKSAKLGGEEPSADKAAFGVRERTVWAACLPFRDRPGPPATGRDRWRWAGYPIVISERLVH